MLQTTNNFVYISLCFQILGGEADYRIVIIPGFGSEISMDIVTSDNCSDDSCSYIFSSASITDLYSVAVEVVGCITERINPISMSSCKFTIH